MEKFKVLKNETINVGPIQKQRINISQTNNKPISLKEVKKLVLMLQKIYKDKKKKDPKILVRGLDILGNITLKGYDDSVDDMFEDVEDYLKGRVQSSTKYSEFRQLEICLFS